MEDIFIELQIAIEEGACIDLINEDCHRLNDYLDAQNKLIADHKAVAETMQNKIDELKAEKNKAKAELFNVMRVLSDENKTEMEISQIEQVATEWMNNWIDS